MNDQSQMLLRSVKGPVIMITVGVLFAADRFTGYHFYETWPVLLIVVGLMQLAGGRRRRTEYYPPPAPPPPTQFSPPYAPPTYPSATTPATPTRQEGEEPRS